MIDEAQPSVVGLIGNPVEHSLSPVVQMAAYGALHLPWEYRLFPCADEAQACERIGSLRSAQLVGLNVTMPYKRLALQMADDADPSAVISGGGNVLFVRDGKLHLTSTDGYGAVLSLIHDGGMQVEGQSFLVCGTGPTSASTVLALYIARAAEVTVMSRTDDGASALVARFDESLKTVGRRSGFGLIAATYGQAKQVMRRVDGIIDATPCGMRPEDPSVLPVDCFAARHVLLDTVYAHGTTAIVEGARRRGARAFDGLGMLVGQAIASIEAWTRNVGLEVGHPPYEAMRQAAERELARRVTGGSMPPVDGSGKGLS